MSMHGEASTKLSKALKRKSNKASNTNSHNLPQMKVNPDAKMLIFLPKNLQKIF